LPRLRLLLGGRGGGGDGRFGDDDDLLLRALRGGGGLRGGGAGVFVHLLDEEVVDDPRDAEDQEERRDQHHQPDEPVGEALRPLWPGEAVEVGLARHAHHVAEHRDRHRRRGDQHLLPQRPRREERHGRRHEMNVISDRSPAHASATLSGRIVPSPLEISIFVPERIDSMPVTLQRRDGHRGAKCWSGLASQL
jgi:hypothetical protein